MQGTTADTLIAESGEASTHTSDFKKIAVLLVCLTLSGLVCVQTRPRARDLGVPFDGVPGPLNAITDVKGVEVGHATLISGDAASPAGAGPVRTGVTAILPRGQDSNDPVFAGLDSGCVIFSRADEAAHGPRKGFSPPSS